MSEKDGKIFMNFKKPLWADTMESPEKSEEVLKYFRELTGKDVRFALFAFIASKSESETLLSTIGLVGIYKIPELVQLVENVQDYIILTIKENVRMRNEKA